MNQEIYDLAEKVGRALKNKGLSIVTAESCTGGLLAASLIDVPGSSAYFERGFVVYSNAAKKENLGVSSQSIEEFGAVSSEVAREMAKGALRNSHAQVSISITGIAGPGGGTKNKPVGTICFSLGHLDLPVKTFTMHFDGDRNSVRTQAVKFALESLLTFL